MPTIKRLTNVTLYIYADDHAPPHFHAVGPHTDVQIEIETLQALRGRYHRIDLVEAVTWAAQNQSLLRAKWNEFNDRG